MYNHDREVANQLFVTVEFLAVQPLLDLQLDYYCLEGVILL